MQGKTGAILGVLLSIILIATAISAITAISLNTPADNSYLSGTQSLTATVTGTADNASFWNSTDGITWTLIGTNSTSGSSFLLSWNTAGVDMTGVIIKVNASNDTTTVSDQNSGIVVDNTLPVISSITEGTPEEYGITITWTTDENANSSISYYNTTLNTTSSNNNVTSHSITLSNLLENTLYEYNVTSCDKAENCQTDTGNSFTTASQAPVITSVTESTIHSDYSIITWTTHEDANATVNYGTTTALGSSASNTTNSTSQLVNITSLTNGTLYYYNVTSCDAAGNCNTTGPESFTSLVDTTDPVIANTLINGSTTLAAHVGDLINITASINENTNVSSAWAKFEYQDGTSETKSMSAISGSGDVFTYGTTHTISKSGQQNVTVFATDLYSNTNNGTVRSLTGYGNFTLTANISNTFKNFSYGTTYVYKVTITNDNNVTENYTLFTNITNISGWSVSQGADNITNLASLGQEDVVITVTVPANASNNTLITTYVNSTPSGSNYSLSKAITFDLPAIAVSMPEYQYVTNNSNLTNITYYYYNNTETTWLKEINITGLGTVTSEVDGDITSVSTVNCTLTQAGVHKYTGLYNSTKKTCWFNATGMTTGLYNLTVNASHNTKKHNGTQEINLMLPSNLTINLNNPTSQKSNTFTMSGNAKYNNEIAAPYLTIYTYYGGYSCNGTTNYAGSFGFSCQAPSGTGSFQITANSSVGVWNITGETTGTITVTDSTTVENNTTPTTSNYIQVNTSVSSITLTENTTLELSILNNRTSTQTYTLELSQGDYKRFNTEAVETINIFSKQVKKTNITLSPIEMAKPGTYTLTITIPEENIQKTVTVIVPAPTYTEEEVNTNRYIEEKQDNSSSNVVIQLTNRKNNSVIVEIVETIPKDFANHTDYLVFNPAPTEILQADPVVMWLVSLDAGETKEITYTANNTVENITFSTPVPSITDVLDDAEQVTAGSVEDSNKIIWIVAIIVLTAIIVAVIMYKDEILKKTGSSSKFIKPTDIGKKPVIITKKETKYDSPYPGRKLDSFGEKTKPDLLGKPLEEKKDDKKVDYSGLKR